MGHGRGVPVMVLYLGNRRQVRERILLMIESGWSPRNGAHGRYMELV